jgi:hypothetical protein
VQPTILQAPGMRTSNATHRSQTSREAGPFLVRSWPTSEVSAHSRKVESGQGAVKSAARGPGNLGAQVDPYGQEYSFPRHSGHRWAASWGQGSSKQDQHMAGVSRAQ